MLKFSFIFKIELIVIFILIKKSVEVYFGSRYELLVGEFGSEYIVNNVLRPIANGNNCYMGDLAEELAWQLGRVSFKNKSKFDSLEYLIKF